MVTSKYVLLFVTTLVPWACTHANSTALHEPVLPPLLVTSPGGNSIKLNELWLERKATVLVFWSTGCPCVRRYQQRIDALLDMYPRDKVQVLGISSNAGESFEEVKRVAKERGVRIEVFRDDSGQVAQTVGARTTPTVVVIDQSGNIRFRGWIDNERLPGDPDREAYLDNALRGVLEQRNDFPTRSPMYGCAITRSLFRAPGCQCHQHQ